MAEPKGKLVHTTRLIRSLDDVSKVTRSCKRILTLFSGGLDSTYVLKELAAARECEIVALTVDLGDGVNRDDLQAIAARFGARSVVIDAREAFARDAVLPALRANARYLSIYPISSSLSRPVIARHAVELARELQCEAIIHTANQSQNSLRRLNGAIRQLGYAGLYGSPYEYSALTRQEKIDSLALLGLDRFQARGISGDANLWCREFESGSLDNPEDFSVPESLFEWTAAGREHQFDSELRIDFEQGVPVALDGVRMAPVQLIDCLNRKAGSFGIGRYAGLEHLDFQEKVLEVREAPAACLLMDAYRQLETATLDAELLREKLSIEQLWVREAVEGRWFGELRLAAESFIASTAHHVAGSVRYQLRRGAADLCAIQARHPRYLTDRDAWEKQVARIRGRRGLDDMAAPAAAARAAQRTTLEAA